MKILIADDHALFLKGLELILQDLSPHPQIVSAKNYFELFETIEKDKTFDLILTDLAMPGAKWLDAIQKIYTSLPNTPIIVLSAIFDKEIVQKTIDIGVAGYIPKTSSNAVILSAINLVLSGGMYIPQELISNIPTDDLKTVLPEDSSDNSVLTARQTEVLKLIAKGFSNKQIAFEMGLTEGTVKLHVTAILKTLDVYNRTGAVIKATEQKLI